MSKIDKTEATSSEVVYEAGPHMPGVLIQTKSTVPGSQWEDREFFVFERDEGVTYVMGGPPSEEQVIAAAIEAANMYIRNCAEYARVMVQR